MAKNTDLVKPGDIKSYKDFLDPKWKGKIVIGDPTIPGSAMRWFSVVGTKIMGLDYMRELAKQEPVFTRDERLATEWAARAKYALLFGVKPDPITEFIRAGASLDYILPSEGTWLTAGAGAISLINRAAHPNAAKVFLNWLLTKEGQTVYSRAAGVQSARLDGPVDHLEARLLRDPSIKYFVTEEEEFLSKDSEYMRFAREIFGTLLK